MNHRGSHVTGRRPSFAGAKAYFNRLSKFTPWFKIDELLRIALGRGVPLNPSRQCFYVEKMVGHLNSDISQLLLGSLQDVTCFVEREGRGKQTGPLIAINERVPVNYRIHEGGRFC
jgi:hypothetical protein